MASPGLLGSLRFPLAGTAPKQRKQLAHRYALPDPVSSLWRSIGPVTSQQGQGGGRTGEESSLMMVAGRASAPVSLGDREYVCRVDRVCLNTRSLLFV